jgi:hypothetical protein
MAQQLYHKYQLNKRLGGPQEGWYGCSGEKKNVIPQPKIKLRFLCHFAHSSSLTSLSYHSSVSRHPTRSTALLAQTISCSVSQGRSRLPQIQPLVHTSGYCRFVLYSTLGHVGGSNNFGGYTLMRVATTHAGQLDSGLPKSRWKVLRRRVHGTGLETAVSLINPLGNWATPHSKKAFHLHGAP